MSFQVEIGSLGGTVFFQVGLCTPLRTTFSTNVLLLFKHFFLVKYDQIFDSDFEYGKVSLNFWEVKAHKNCKNAKQKIRNTRKI